MATGKSTAKKTTGTQAKAGGKTASRSPKKAGAKKRGSK